MPNTVIRHVKPDAKGRVMLGNLAEGISSFAVSMDTEGRYILEPFVEISAKDRWLFNNAEALAQVKKGLKDAAAGKVRDLGSFAKYIKDDEQ